MKYYSAEFDDFTPIAVKFQSPDGACWAGSSELARVSGYFRALFDHTTVELPHIENVMIGVAAMKNLLRAEINHSFELGLIMTRDTYHTAIRYDFTTARRAIEGLSVRKTPDGKRYLWLDIAREVEDPESIGAMVTTVLDIPDYAELVACMKGSKFGDCLAERVKQHHTRLGDDRRARRAAAIADLMSH